jgi:hypothetical protein
MKDKWKAAISIAWMIIVFAFFLRQYVEKVLDKLGI